MPNIRKPDNLHILEGTFRKDRHNAPENQVDIDGDLPKCPTWLDADAKKEWKRIVKALKPLRILTAADFMVMIQYVQLFSEFKREGSEFTAAKHTQLRMMYGELGLSPASRAKLNLATSDEEDADPWADL